MYRLLLLLSLTGSLFAQEAVSTSRVEGLLYQSTGALFDGLARIALVKPHDGPGRWEQQVRYTPVQAGRLRAEVPVTQGTAMYLQVDLVQADRVVETLYWDIPARATLLSPEAVRLSQAKPSVSPGTASHSPAPTDPLAHQEQELRLRPLRAAAYQPHAVLRTNAWGHLETVDGDPDACVTVQGRARPCGAIAAPAPAPTQKTVQAAGAASGLSVTPAPAPGAMPVQPGKGLLAAHTSTHTMLLLDDSQVVTYRRIRQEVTWPLLAGQTCLPDQQIPAPGAQVGHTVLVQTPAVPAGVTIQGQVTQAEWISVRACNLLPAPAQPPTGMYSLLLIP